MINVLFDVLDKNGIFSRDRENEQCSVTNSSFLNEMVISSGNENNTHFPVTHETESIPEHNLSHRIVTFDKLWTTS